MVTFVDLYFLLTICVLCTVKINMCFDRRVVRVLSNYETRYATHCTVHN